MQPVASTSAPTVSPLTERNLALHTSVEGVAPRRTVQIYLQSIKEARVYFEIPFQPIQDSDSPPARPVAGPSYSRVSTLAHEHKRRKLDEEEEVDDRDVALVMHRGGPRAAKDKSLETSKGILKPSKGVVPLKKKPSLVSAMRPRLVSVSNDFASPVKKERSEKIGKRKKEPDSPDPAGVPSREGEKENQRRGETTKGKERKGKGKTEERSEEEVVAKRSEKGKGKLRSEPENEKEAAELEERLEARKERRRHKAVIRKDRSQSAAATGVAAASKLKASKKRRPEDDVGSNASEEGDKKGGKTKKGRRTAEQSGRELVQGLERPVAIGPGRLTLKTSAQLGIFNKGKASARVKVGKAVPDLAFSEMRFLNSTRPPASPSSSSSSEAEQTHGRPVPSRGTSRIGKTYGSKRSLRNAPRTKLQTESISTASEAEGPPPPIELRSSKHEKQAASPKPRRSMQGTSRHVFSHVEVPPPFRSSSSLPARSRSSPTMSPTKRQPSPPPTALEFVAQEESNFSAHSAHSLAMRRRSLSARRATGDVDPVFEPVTEEGAVEVEEQTPADVPQQSMVEPDLSPLHFLAQSRQPTPVPFSGPSAHVTAATRPTSSIQTESIDQILRDNASTKQTNTPYNSTSIRLTSSAVQLDESQSSLLQDFYPPQSYLNRSRSSSAAPSFRTPSSFVSRRQRSLSDAAITYDGEIDPNPFAPSNFIALDNSASRASTDSRSGGSDSPGWRELAEHDDDVQGGVDYTSEEGPVDERFSHPACQWFNGVEQDEAFAENSYDKAVDEFAVANLWERNIL
ncbi:hypothetical protein JCM16303_002960 [Sporobolomyces ruberrimus]